MVKTVFLKRNYKGSDRSDTEPEGDLYSNDDCSSAYYGSETPDSSEPDSYDTESQWQDEAKEDSRPEPTSLYTKEPIPCATEKTEVPMTLQAQLDELAEDSEPGQHTRLT